MSELKSMEELFEGRHFDREVIIVCVRWYLRFKLSLRDLVEMMAGRGLSLAHMTIMRWVQRHTPARRANRGEIGIARTRAPVAADAARGAPRQRCHALPGHLRALPSVRHHDHPASA